MKFSEFLNEITEEEFDAILYKNWLKKQQNPYKTVLELDDIIEKIKKEYGDLPSINEVFFRGMTGDKDAYLLNSSSRVRASKDASNHYTIIFDEYLKKKNLPLRSKSLICSTSKTRAEGFNSSLYVIIPVNKDSTIGVVNKEDIWDLKFKLGDDLTALSHSYSTLDIEDESFNDIVRGIKNVVTGSLEDDEEGHKKRLVKYFNAKRSIKNQLLDHYDLEKMGATFETFQNASKKNNTEVWFSDKAYAIEYSVYRKLLKK